MVVTGPELAIPRSGSPARVIWHDLECGAYRADLPLWRELSELACREEPSAAILDLGAGTGRVALDLARAGRRVTALDRDGELLAELRRRTGAAPVETVHADARSFELARSDYALCLVPMQTIQLLGGSSARLELLRRARAHLRPGGLFACAIVTEIEPFDVALEGRGPSPELATVGSEIFSSRALSVRVSRRTIRIERERTVTSAASPKTRAPQRERDVIELDRVSAARLGREGVQAAFSQAGTRTIAATEEHVGSTVVMLRA